MKVGTIRSLCPYDAAARHASQSAKLRHPTTLHYASRAGCLPDFSGWSGHPSIAALSIKPRIDVMCQNAAFGTPCGASRKETRDWRAADRRFDKGEAVDFVLEYQRLRAEMLARSRQT